MRREGVDALLVAATNHMRYLIGWSEPAGERFLGLWLAHNMPPTAIVPSLYREDIERHAPLSLKIVAYDDGSDWDAWLRIVRDALGATATVAVDDEMLAGHLLRLQEGVRDYTWVSAGSIMAQVRGVKEPAELRLLEHSANIADSVFEAVLPSIRCGMTEEELAHTISKEFAARGAGSSWAIVAFGANSSMPHHRTGSTQLERGMVVVLDLGGSKDGYQSDITRTLVVDAADAELQHIYHVVYQAHIAAYNAARPGARCADVDAAARAVIRDAGYGDYFIHRTGHGIGLSTHEPPNLSGDDETVLTPGMCFSDEPGIYLPGRYGVRIENIITITEDGARSLNAPPPVSVPILEV